MTTFGDAPDDPTKEPSVQAFVVGVGQYDRVGARLTSPPRSSLVFADWVLDRLRHPTCRKVQLELLVSADPLATYRGQAVAPATMANVRAAFKAWYERAHTHLGNVALFYFCGHGLAAGIEELLLTQEFAADALQPGDAAIDLYGLAAGMARCKARQQIFVVDACRDMPSWALSFTRGLSGQPLVADNVDDHPDEERECPILRSAAEGKKAFGAPDGVSPFTSALLQALDGAGCDDRYDPGQWSVRVESLIPNVSALLRADPTTSKVQPRLTGECSSFVLHVPDPPRIPVWVSCDPTTDNAVATFVAARQGREVERRPPAPADWVLRCPLDPGGTEPALWEFRAELPAAKIRTASLPLRPPLGKVVLR